MSEDQETDDQELCPLCNLTKDKHPQDELGHYCSSKAIRAYEYKKAYAGGALPTTIMIVRNTRGESMVLRLDD